MRGDQRGVDLGDQEFVPDFGEERCIDRFHKAPFAGNGLDRAKGFQFSVGLRDCVAIQMQLFGEGADRGKGIVRLKGSRSGGESNLIHQLPVKRRRRVKIDLEEHTVI